MLTRLRAWWAWMHEAPAVPQSFGSVVAWWERRRLAYTGFVAATGLLSLTLFSVAIEYAGHLPPGEDAVEPFALLLAPILANLAYTAGWIVEGVLLPAGPTRPLGPRLMRAGLLFSLGVMLLPSAVWGAIWLFRSLSLAAG
jgi:hypothetical protein